MAARRPPQLVTPHLFIPPLDLKKQKSYFRGMLAVYIHGIDQTDRWKKDRNSPSKLPILRLLNPYHFIPFLLEKGVFFERATFSRLETKEKEKSVVIPETTCDGWFLGCHHIHKLTNFHTKKCSLSDIMPCYTRLG